MKPSRRTTIVATALLAFAPVLIGQQPSEAPQDVTLETRVGSDIANNYYSTTVAKGFGRGPAVSGFTQASINGLVPGTFTFTGFAIYNVGDRHNPESPGGGMHEVDSILTYSSPKLKAGNWVFQVRPSIMNWQFPSGWFAPEPNWLAQADIDASYKGFKAGLRWRGVVDNTPYGGGFGFVPQASVSHGVRIPALEKRGYKLTATHGVRVPISRGYYDYHGALGVDINEAISVGKGPYEVHTEFGYVRSIKHGHPNGWHYAGGMQYSLPKVRLPLKRIFR
jgi:hypothetical protein